MTGRPECITSLRAQQIEFVKVCLDPVAFPLRGSGLMPEALALSSIYRDVARLNAIGEQRGAEIIIAAPLATPTCVNGRLAA